MAPRKRNTLVVTADNTAEYTCVCGAAHALTVEADLLRSSTPVRVRFRCPCGRRRVFFLERRAAVRRDVDLPGLCSFRRGRDPRPVRIRNLSRTGALLEVDREPVPAVGERLVLEFELAHAEVSRFSKRAVVRRATGREVGIEFFGGEYDRVYDMALALLQVHPTPPG